jgi:glutamate dehydrogenase/leucine dehydrogenase
VAEVADPLQKIMIRSFKEVQELAKKHKVVMRIAAYILRVWRVAQATNCAGFIRD